MQKPLKDGWRKVKLKEVCHEITVGHVGSMAKEYVDKGIPFLRSQNILPFSLELSSVKYVTPEFHGKLKKSALFPGDVAVVRTGYPGTACVIPSKLSICNCADLVIIRPSEEVNAKYLTCVFNSTWGQGTIAGTLVGVAQQHFNVSAAKEMEVNLPPRHTQDKIAAIIYNYNDLIENNTRRIEILEEMARSLYREWFVNFRFPGHEQVKMVDSGLGLIPEGWQAVTVEDIGAPGKSIVSGPFGSNIGKKFFVEEGVPVIRGNNLTLRNKKFIDEGFVFVTKEKAFELRNCEALPDDIVFTAAGTLGQVGIIPKNPKYQKYIISNKQLRLRCNKDIALPEYIYYWLSTPEMREHIINQNTGSSVPLITLGTLRKIPVLLPSISIQHKFAAFVVNRDNLAENLERKNANLRQTRDLLLPKLISGEIDVENLEINTGEIAA